MAGPESKHIFMACSRSQVTYVERSWAVLLWPAAFEWACYDHTRFIPGSQFAKKQERLVLICILGD